MERYEYPEIFVENIESDTYIVEKDGGFYLRRGNPRLVHDIKRYFGHIIYEDIIKYIDLTVPTNTRSFIVIPRYSEKTIYEGLLVEKNTRLCLLEVKGAEPYVFPAEGEEVGEREKIAYIITNKGEVRVVKSFCKGIVLLVIDFPWEKPERYLVVIGDEKNVRKITIRKST